VAKRRKNKGWEQKLTELLGEHLVASHLTRNGLLVSFTPRASPNVDLLATNESLRTLPIQLNTIRTGTCQMHADRFLDIKFSERAAVTHQRVRGKRRLPDPTLPWVFVWLGNDGEDEFYVCLARDVQDTIYRKYLSWLKRCKGVRPKNSRSTHCGLERSDLTRFRDKWNTILNHHTFR
jgi:hypothetical protein